MYDVMCAIGFLEKENEVSMGGGRGYGYVSEAQFVSAVRPQMIKHGLVLFPVSMNQTTETTITKDASGKEKSNYYVNVSAEYRLADVESGESVVISVLGTGVDSGDKAIYKAMTGAFRTMLRQSFMIGTGEDPEATDADGTNTLVSPITAAANAYFTVTGTKFSKEMLKSLGDLNYAIGAGYGLEEQKTAKFIRDVAKKVKSGVSFDEAIVS